MFCPRGYHRRVRLFTSGLIGVGIATLCVLPPVLNFVLGPLGPLFGGVIGGYRGRGRVVDAVIVGLAIGTGLALLIGVGAFVLDRYFEVPVRFAFALTGALFVFAYAWVLGFWGALIGAWWQKKSSEMSK